MRLMQDNSWLTSASRGKAGASVTAVVLAVAVIACGSSSESSPDDQHPRVVVVEPSEVLELPTDTDPQLVLKGTHSDFVAGNFLTAEPDWTDPDPHVPEGFLLKVEKVAVADGVTTVDVKSASLFEAEPEGTLNMIDESFSPIEASQVEDSTPVSALARASLTDRGVEPDPVGGMDEFFSKTLGCGSPGEISVDTAVETSLKPQLILEWKQRGRFPIGVDYAAAWVEGNAMASITAGISGELHCEPNPIVLVRQRWRTVVFVGQVPVPVTIGLPVELAASAWGKEETSIKASITSNATIGVARKGGETERIGEFVPPMLEGEFDPELTLKANAEVTVFPAVSIEAGWKAPGLGKLAAAATLGLRGGINFRYAADKDPSAQACVPVRVEARLEVQLVRKLFGPWTVTPYKRNLACRPPDPETEGESRGD